MLEDTKEVGLLKSPNKLSMSIKVEPDAQSSKSSSKLGDSTNWLKRAKTQTQFSSSEAPDKSHAKKDKKKKKKDKKKNRSVSGLGRAKDGS